MKVILETKNDEFIDEVNIRSSSLTDLVKISLLESLTFDSYDVFSSADIKKLLPELEVLFKKSRNSDIDNIIKLIKKNNINESVVLTFLST